MKRILVFIALVCMLCSSIWAQGPSLVFGNRIGAQGTDEAYATAVDADGNVYTVGSYQWTVDFDPSSAGTYSIQMQGSKDIFITKEDSSGNFLWARSFGDLWDDKALTIALSTTGEPVIGGSFIGTVDFDPGPGTFNLTTNGTPDGFVLKLDANGNFGWAFRIGGTSNDQVNSISCSSSNEYYISGYFQGTVDFDPGSGTQNLTASAKDAFILKVDNTTAYQWAYRIGGSSANEGKAVHASSNNEVLWVGEYTGTIDLDPTAGSQSATAAGLTDIFMISLSNTGTFNWGGALRGSGNAYANDVTKLPNGNVVVAGAFDAGMDFDPGAGTQNMTSAGSTDAFIVTLNGSGTFQYADQIGGTGADAINAIDHNAAGDILMTGKYAGTANFDPNGAGLSLTSNSSSEDAFVAIWTSLGALTYVRTFPGSGADAGYGIDSYDANNFYTVGAFSNTVQFGYPFSLNLTSNAGTDIFVLRHYMCTSSGLPDPILFGDTLVCEGVPATYYINPVPGATSILWQVPSNWTGTSTTDTISVNPMQSGGYVIVEVRNICGGSNEVDILVQVEFPLDSLSAMVGDTFQCPDESGTYSVDPINNVDTYVWTIPAGWSGTSTTNSISILTGATGGPVILTASNFCGSQSSTIMVTVPLIDSTITVVGDTLTANQAGATYQWFDCNSSANIPNATGQTLVAPSSTGSYACTIILGDCGINTPCINLPYVGIDKPSGAEVKLFPNPSSGSFKISSSENIHHVEVFNLMGQKVHVAGFSGAAQVEMNLELNSGVYFVRVKDQFGLVSTEKLTIE